jgi:hypothetical protein
MRHACVRLTGNGGAPYVRDAIAINTTPQQSESHPSIRISSVQHMHEGRLAVSIKEHACPSGR